MGRGTARVEKCQSFVLLTIKAIVLVTYSVVTGVEPVCFTAFVVNWSGQNVAWMGRRGGGRRECVV